MSRLEKRSEKTHKDRFGRVISPGTRVIVSRYGRLAKLYDGVVEKIVVRPTLRDPNIGIDHVIIKLDEYAGLSRRVPENLIETDIIVVP